MLLKQSALLSTPDNDGVNPLVWIRVNGIWYHAVQYLKQVMIYSCSMDLVYVLDGFDSNIVAISGSSNEGSIAILLQHSIIVFHPQIDEYSLDSGLDMRWIMDSKIAISSYSLSCLTLSIDGLSLMAGGSSLLLFTLKVDAIGKQREWNLVWERKQLSDVHGVSFSPCNRFLISHSVEKPYLRIWWTTRIDDLSENGDSQPKPSLRCAFIPLAVSVLQFAWLPKYAGIAGFATLGSDGNVLLWQESPLKDHVSFSFVGSIASNHWKLEQPRMCWVKPAFLRKRKFPAFSAGHGHTADLWAEFCGSIHRQRSFSAGQLVLFDKTGHLIIHKIVLQENAGASGAEVTLELESKDSLPGNSSSVSSIEIKRLPNDVRLSASFSNTFFGRGLSKTTKYVVSVATPERWQSHALDTSFHVVLKLLEVVSHRPVNPVHAIWSTSRGWLSASAGQAILYHLKSEHSVHAESTFDALQSWHLPSPIDHVLFGPNNQMLWCCGEQWLLVSEGENPDPIMVASTPPVSKCVLLKQGLNLHVIALHKQSTTVSVWLWNVGAQSLEQLCSMSQRTLVGEEFQMAAVSVLPGVPNGEENMWTCTNSGLLQSFTFDGKDFVKGQMNPSSLLGEDEDLLSWSMPSALHCATISRKRDESSMCRVAFLSGTALGSGFMQLFELMVPVGEQQLPFVESYCFPSGMVCHAVVDPVALQIRIYAPSSGDDVFALSCQISHARNGHIRSLVWLDIGAILVRFDSEVVVYGPWVDTAAGKFLRDIWLGNGEVPDYHPLVLRSLLFKGDYDRMEFILGGVLEALQQVSERSEVSGKKESVSHVRHVSVSEFMGYCLSEKDGTPLLSDRDLASLSELLAEYSLPGLAPPDQLSLMALADALCLVREQSSADAVDKFAKPFLTMHRAVSLSAKYSGSKILPKAATAWAFHSESQEALLALCIPDANMTWSSLAELAAPLWLKNITSLRQVAEKLAKQQFLKQKDPADCALLYMALQKRSVLQGLFKMVKNETVYGFLSKDFSDPRWQAAASKNAYALMKKHQYSFAAAFFLLSGSVRDAINVCVQYLNDPMLALMIVRLFKGDSTEDTWFVLREVILPHFREQGDTWGVSVGLWLLEKYEDSLECLLDSAGVCTQATFDPSIRNFVELVQKKPVLKNYKCAIEKLERISYRSAEYYARNGSPLMALYSLFDLFTTPPEAQKIEESIQATADSLFGEPSDRAEDLFGLSSSSSFASDFFKPVAMEVREENTIEEVEGSIVGKSSDRNVAISHSLVVRLLMQRLQLVEPGALPSESGSAWVSEIVEMFGLTPFEILGAVSNFAWIVGEGSAFVAVSFLREIKGGEPAWNAVCEYFVHLVPPSIVQFALVASENVVHRTMQTVSQLVLSSSALLKSMSVKSMPDISRECSDIALVITILCAWRRKLYESITNFACSDQHASISFSSGDLIGLIDVVARTSGQESEVKLGRLWASLDSNTGDRPTASTRLLWCVLRSLLLNVSIVQAQTSLSASILNKLSQYEAAWLVQYMGYHADEILTEDLQSAAQVVRHSMLMQKLLRTGFLKSELQSLLEQMFESLDNSVLQAIVSESTYSKSRSTLESVVFATQKQVFYSDKASFCEGVEIMKSKDMVRGLCINSANPDIFAIATTKGIREASFKLSLKYRRRSLDRRELLDEDAPGWNGAYRSDDSQFRDPRIVPNKGSPGPKRGVPRAASVAAIGAGSEMKPISSTSSDKDLSHYALWSHPKLPLYMASDMEGGVSLWEFGQPIVRSTIKRSSRVNQVAFSPFGDIVVSAEIAGNMSLYALEEANLSKRCFLEVSAAAKRLNDVCFLSSNHLLATAGENPNNRNVCIWDLHLPAHSACVQSFLSHDYGAHSVAFLPSEGLIVSGGHKGAINIFDLRKGRLLTSIPNAHSLNVKSLSVDPWSDLFVSGSTDGDVSLWSAKSFQRVHVWENAHEKKKIFLVQGGAAVSTYGVMQVALTDRALFSVGVDGRLVRRARGYVDTSFWV